VRGPRETAEKETVEARKGQSTTASRETARVSWGLRGYPALIGVTWFPPLVYNATVVVYDTTR